MWRGAKSVKQKSIKPFDVKYLVTIMLIATLASCGGDKKEAADAAKKDSLVIPQATEVVGIGRIEPEGGLINLSSDQTGIIRQLLIKEGDSVRRSQTIMILDNSVQSSQVGEAGRRLETELAQIPVNNAAIAEAEENLRKAEEDLVKTKRLVEKGAETKQKLDDAQADVNNKRIALQNQRATLGVTEKRVNELRQQINTAKTTVSKYTVTAPSDGLVLQVDVKPGEVVTTGQSFAEFAPAGKLSALCEIDELFADKIKPGQQATIRYKGYTDVVATGTVTYTAPFLKKKSLFSDQVGEKEDRRVREVRIVLNKQDLLINRQVECVINIK